ncbi:MAG: reductive dehalogenase [Desulfobacteraceae bacterium]|nr:reductive dehalogenase [Desulfobacteraceae bacterium]
MNVLIVLLLTADFFLFSAFLYFTFESYREQELRAAKNGALGTMLTIFLSIVIFIPQVKMAVLLFFIAGAIFSLSLLIPASPNKKALKGAKGYLVGQPQRFDERDSIFARHRSLIPGAEHYNIFYKEIYPEKEEHDAKRRQTGILGRPGKIDNEYQPNVAMMHASFSMPMFLGSYASNDPEPGTPISNLSPEKATLIVKNLAMHIGADLVGITKVDPDLIYSNQGEIHYDTNDWGRKIKGLPPYAVVMATEMNYGHVISAPHTPTVAESAHLYARGAYLSTLLARWFSHMGYRGVAEHSRNYDMPLPPLAADAGLGEVGRQGYLIAPKFGARVRIFAVLTDMPLIPDKPISLGVEEFCKSCKKCADSCPSKSIPHGEKEIFNGFEKWKLDEDSCFDYWSKVGTDCSICMAICPFSRPNTLLHKFVRLFVAKSKIAQILFPYVDNFLYGKKWRPKTVVPWLNYKHTKKKDKTEIY